MSDDELSRVLPAAPSCYQLPPALGAALVANCEHHWGFGELTIKCVNTVLRRDESLREKPRNGPCDVPGIPTTFHDIARHPTSTPRVSASYTQTKVKSCEMRRALV